MDVSIIDTNFSYQYHHLQMEATKPPGNRTWNITVSNIMTCYRPTLHSLLNTNCERKSAVLRVEFIELNSANYLERCVS